eukprot:10780749-Lingulodinium_polyedra.AAC.1
MRAAVVVAAVAFVARHAVHFARRARRLSLRVVSHTFRLLRPTLLRIVLHVARAAVAPRSCCAIVFARAQ